VLSIVEKTSCIGPRKRVYNVPVQMGAPVYAYIPSHFHDMEVVAVMLNHVLLTENELHSVVPKPGDIISLAPFAGVSVIVMLVISAVLLASSWALKKHEQTSLAHAQRHAKIGDSYLFDIMSNSWQEGKALPVIYGTHRVGGQFLQLFTRQHEEGVDKLQVLLGLSEGPVDEINPSSTTKTVTNGAWAAGVVTITVATHGYFLGDIVIVSGCGNANYDGIYTIVAVPTASTFTAYLVNNPGAFTTNGTARDTKGTSDLHIDGNSSANYRNIMRTEKIGTNTDTVIPDLREVVTANAYNVQVGLGSNTTVNGTTASNAFQIKGTFASGLYELDGDGHPKPGWLRLYYKFRTTAGPGAWSSNVYPTNDPFNTDVPGEYRRRRTTPYSIWIKGTFPSKDTYDVFIGHDNGIGHDGSNQFCDFTVKEYQEIAYDDLRYPNVAKIAVTTIAHESLSGQTPRITSLVKGRKIMSLSSATAVAAAAYSNNPADVFLDLMYNRLYGFGSYVDARMNLTVAGIAGGPFTIGEVVTGPTSDYQFRGIWKALSGTTATIECVQGIPHGTLLGGTSGATCNITTIDEAYATDLPKLWEFSQFCDEQVPDGSTITTVDANSASGQKVLNVASTTPFTAGDSVVINYGGIREEDGTINTVQAGVSITLFVNMTYTHTAGQADEVSVAENRMEFDYVYDGGESAWDALERICKCSRALLVHYGAKIWPRPLKSETPGQLVCMGNQGVHSFKVSYLPTGDRPNMIDMHYLDKGYDYRKRTASMEAPELLANSEKVRRIELELYGVTRESQASREGFFRLKRLRYTSKQIEFKMGIEHIDFEVGDVFRFQHDVPGIGAAGGRIVSSTNSTALLDHDVTLAGGETIRVRHTDDTQETQTITTAAGTVREISIAAATWTTNPAGPDVTYVIGTPGQYRCISLRPNEDGIATITAEEDDSAYYVDDYGTVPTFTETTLFDPNAMPSDVSNLTLHTWTSVNQDQTITYTIQADWIKPEDKNYAYAEAWLMDDSSFIAEQSKQNYESGTGNGEFDRPWGTCSDGTYTYTIDYQNHRVVKLNALTLAWVANYGSFGAGNVQFKYPADICTDGTHLWIIDSGNYRVQKITVGGVFVAELGARGAGNDQFEMPLGICHDQTSTICVADTYNHRIVEIDDALVGVGGGTWNAFGANGAANGEFERPMGIDVNPTDSMYYVADTGNSRIQAITTALVFSAKIGTLGTGDDNFKFPMDVACDVNGDYIWVADTGNHRVVTREDDLSYYTEVGSEGHLHDQFDQPGGIAFYNGELYVTEIQNHRIQRRYAQVRTTDDYEYMGDSYGELYRINMGNAAGKQFKIAVVSVGRNNVKKSPVDGVTATVTIPARTTVPPDVQTLAVVGAGNQARLTWSAGKVPDFAGYEIRVGNAWSTATKIALTQDSYITVPAPAAGYSRTYYCAGKTTSNVYSATPASVTYTAPFLSFPLAGGLGSNYAT